MSPTQCPRYFRALEPILLGRARGGQHSQVLLDRRDDALIGERARVLGESLGVPGKVDVVLHSPAPWMVGPAAGLGEGVELGVLPDHLFDPLARGGVQLLERDLADDPVAHVAPGEGGRGPGKRTRTQASMPSRRVFKIS